MVSESTQQISFRTWLRRIFAAALIVTYLPLVVVLMQIAIVPSKYLLIGLPVYGIIIAMLVYVLLASKKLATHRMRMISVLVCSVIMCAANVAGVMAIRSANGLLGGIQSSQQSYIEYVVLAKKDAQVQVATAETVGVVQTDPTFDAAMQALQNETPAAQRPYATLTDLTEAVRTDQVVLSSMRTASWQLLQDNYKDFYDELSVLARYRVRAESTAVSNADISKPFALYISGIDTYGDVSKVSRSDVNMIAAVNPGTNSILLVNTPRDYYVQLHGTTGTPDKLTHAGTYGIDMSRQTLEDLYQTQIPYYARINFTSLVKIIDTIGPIDVYSDYSFKSYHEGYNTLDSKQALEFARERYSFEDGDRQRGRNQQRVIEAIIAKMSKPQNAVHMNEVLSAVKGSLDTNIDEKSIKQFIRMQLDDMKAWRVESISVDGTGATLPTYSMGAQPLYVMIPDDRSLEEARQRIANTLQ